MPILVQETKFVNVRCVKECKHQSREKDKQNSSQTYKNTTYDYSPNTMLCIRTCIKSCMKTCVKTNLFFLKLTSCKNMNDLNQNEPAIMNKYERIKTEKTAVN